MKTAGEEDPNSHVRLHTEPSPWDGKSEPSSLIHTGWKVRKYPAAGEVFFLTFPFIELPRSWVGRPPRPPTDSIGFTFLENVVRAVAPRNVLFSGNIQTSCSRLRQKRGAISCAN